MVLTFIVPCIFISFIFVPKIKEVERENRIEVSKQLFAQSAYGIGTVFSELHRLSYQFLSDKNFKASSSVLGISEQMNIRSTIQNYILNSNYITELAFYSADQGKIYFSEGTIDTKLYFDSVYQYENLKTDIFLETMKNLDYPAGMIENVTVSKNPESKILVVIVPLSNGVFQSVIFHVNLADIIDFAKELVKKPNDVMDLYFNGERIYSTNEKKSGEYRAELKEINREAEIISSKEDQNHLMLLYTPDDSLMQLVLYKTIKDSDLDVSKISYLYMLILILFFAAGCVTVFFMWRRNYRPVKEMLTYLPETKQKTENEFDLVKNTLLNIKTEQEKMSQNFMDSMPAYKKQILTSLLKGEFENIEEFNKKAQKIGFSLKEKNLLILAVSMINSNHPTNVRRTEILEQILAQSEANTQEHFCCYGFVDLMNEKIIYVASIDFSEEEKVEKNLKEFQCSLQESLGFELNIGCSNLYSGTESLPKAYMEALSALDYRIVYGDGKIIYFSQISLNNYSHNWYPEELTRKFRIALKAKDEEQIHEILDETMEDLYRHNTPVYVAKYVCYDLMQMLADSLVVVKALPYKKTIGYHNIMNIARVSTFEEITEILHRNVTYVLSIDVKEKVEDVNQELKKHMEEYIEKNYSDSNFSMASMVEEFGVSESTMRKNFKIVMQTTFIEYLAEKRINRSKELLSNTELPLSKVASEVGYQDVSSFIRRFRQKTGIPPGEYRILTKREEH